MWPARADYRPFYHLSGCSGRSGPAHLSGLPGLALAGLLVIFAGAATASLSFADTPEALISLKSDAEAGSVTAQFDLGNRYLDGEGVEQDNVEALRWFTLAAENDNANAQYNIAVMYLNGIGVVRDPEQAVTWFLKAAENGDPPSQFTLGILLFNGQLQVPQNVAEAYKWFTLAGAAGHQAAAANAVLVQELLPAADMQQKQDEARAWIEAFQQKRADPIPN